MQFDAVVPSLVVEPACRGPEGQANTRSQEWLKRDVISEPQLCAKADALSAARVVVRRFMVGGAGRTAPMRRIANCRSGHCDGRQRVETTRRRAAAYGHRTLNAGFLAMNPKGRPSQRDPQRS
jgi:hypothetical protein